MTNCTLCAERERFRLGSDEHGLPCDWLHLCQGHERDIRDALEDEHRCDPRAAVPPEWHEPVSRRSLSRFSYRRRR